MKTKILHHINSLWSKVVPGTKFKIMTPSFEEQLGVDCSELQGKNRWSLMKTMLPVKDPPSPSRIPFLRSDATRPGSGFFVRDSVMLNLIQNLSFFHLDQERRTGFLFGERRTIQR